MITIHTIKINMPIYFKNLIIKLYVLNILNTHVNFMPIGNNLLFDL